MTAAFGPPRGRQPSIEWVPIGDLLIDDSYQRSIETRASQNLIRAIAAGWDWDVLDVLKVSRRPDDRLFVIDGQHRQAAAALRGDIAQLPCVLKRCAGPADEARLFIAANRGRKAMSRLDDFRAAVGAGDDQACTIWNLVTDAGLTIARHDLQDRFAPGEIAIVVPLRAALARHGAALTAAALGVLAGAFCGQSIVVASPLFGAAVELLAAEAVTAEQMLAVLAAEPCTAWAERIGAASRGGRARVRAMRAAIEQQLGVIRSPAPVTRSLTPPPLSGDPPSPPARQPASPPARQPASWRRQARAHVRGADGGRSSWRPSGERTADAIAPVGLRARRVEPGVA